MAALQKDLGIMVYVDNNAAMVEEFGWIYKSWIYSGNWHNSDLLVVHHPDIGAYLPTQESGVIKIPITPAVSEGSAFANYKFANSIACLSGPEVDPIASRYRYLLRTDADVFLTKYLASFRPSLPVHGRGHYHATDDVRERMLDFCRRHGVTHHNHFGFACSILADSNSVIHFIRRQTYWMEAILDDFGPDPANWGEWPGWYRGVSSLYAAEVAANEYYTDFLYAGRERILDVESWCTVDIDPLVLHIHAVHTTDHFSKHAYRSGDYAHVDLNTLDRDKINQYCHWIAGTPLAAIKQIAGYRE